ncbi:MAG: YifB family Mg chelatase-like AAA ATPase [Asticcacaulis sp.]|jgi:magnesium chelatase family protein|uniref:YifB family Mg chelatase-like AAA ATPase n=1 Tax=Asticcacaulis sp. TaxID=1872648 RepID=UPI0025C28609|nr:YifB family Mg chelatase-like AAA ATPase [Asticcacaulis sp.]MCA1934229.1 YifB family Mg chelatase-like AAA ATPase [Asticcacaulis sp.]
MPARVTTVAFEGAKAHRVEAEVQITSGNLAFVVVGLGDKAVAESRDRVRGAFAGMGLSIPAKRIVANLAPADLPKEGSHYDLPIALALMVMMGVIPQDALDGYVCAGELKLDGQIGAMAGALPAAIAAGSYGMGLICPEANGREAAWAGDVPILAPRSLIDLIAHFKGQAVLSAPQPGEVISKGAQPDLKEVKGQEAAKRALEIAAVGGHNLLFVGPPGSGKSMMAQRLPGILPPLTATELLETSQIWSMAGLLEKGNLTRERPFRSPHHSASMAALTGGGLRAKPGEVSLAHNGVLFLDELPEYSPQALDSLRQPLETGEVVVARANHHIRYPARVQLVAAMNPCRCGYGGVGKGACGKAPKCQRDYQGRVSGPMMDRIDLQIDVPPVTAADMALPPPAEGSAEVAARVQAARHIQTERARRLGLPPEAAVNATASGSALEAIAPLDEAARTLLVQAAQRANLSARAWTRCVRLARTIADIESALSGEDTPLLRRHVAEALIYRRATSEPQTTAVLSGKIPTA